MFHCSQTQLAYWWLGIRPLWERKNILSYVAKNANNVTTPQHLTRANQLFLPFSLHQATQPLELPAQNGRVVGAQPVAEHGGVDAAEIELVAQVALVEVEQIGGGV